MINQDDRRKISRHDDAVNLSTLSPKRRVLLFSYAFPPLKVQMTAPVAKAMKGLIHMGFDVDVVCADAFSPYLPSDDSLMAYVKDGFGTVNRLSPPLTRLTRFRLRTPFLAQMPDLMSVLNRTAFRALMNLDLHVYDAVFTWSPFHTINTVMARVKRYRKEVPWIAQFSDPWAGNPLEKRYLNKIWNQWKEKDSLKHMDYIVHSSRFSRDLMFDGKSKMMKERSSVIPHVYDECLYPSRPKAHNDRITLSYIGVLFDHRSPEPLFRAFVKLLERRPDLSNMLSLQLVGYVPAYMLESEAARSLPSGMIVHVPSVNYIESLRMMYDSDVLVLIEADTKLNLFVPSKLFDYMGANRPIIGLVPKGGSEEVMIGLGADYARPNDVTGIMRVLEDAINKVLEGGWESGLNQEYRVGHDTRNIAAQFINIMKNL